MPEGRALPGISVIVPAYNAGQTLVETLDSLLHQTHDKLEVIVVDDGSTDDTLAIARGYAKRDGRFRVLTQRRRGKAQARNAGIDCAQHAWLLFHDADDLLLPTALETLARAAAESPDTDWVYCAWARVAQDGAWMHELGLADPAQAFAVLARYNPFATNSCLVRRELVLQVGAFDPRMAVAEDWDLWQRLARVGARMRALPETLALYRMRPNSASADVRRLLADGRRVIRRGHGVDRRVRHPAPAHARGMPAHGRVPAEVGLIAWAAGLLFGQGEDPASALPWLPRRLAVPGLDPAAVARAMFIAALLPSARAPTAALDVWAGDVEPVDRFLRLLEARTGSPRLAARVWRELVKSVLDADLRRPVSLGHVSAMAVEITEPLPSLVFGAEIERLRCRVVESGVPIGDVELPVCDGSMPAIVLADAIAASFAWKILGRFFERAVYPQLRANGACNDGEARIARFGVHPASGGTEPAHAGELHERMGWQTLLQEAWGRPGKRADWFYDPLADDGAAVVRAVSGSAVAAVEVADDLPVLVVEGPSAVQVAFLLCGRLVCTCRLEPHEGVITPARMRAAFMATAGAEFCRAVVREVLVGQSWDPPIALRDRLKANVAAETAAARVAALEFDNLLPGWPAAITACVSADRTGWILGRHPGAAADSSASRYACLPVTALPDIRALAAWTGQPLIKLAGDAPAVLVYAPGVCGAKSPSLVSRPTGTDLAASARDSNQPARPVALPILRFGGPSHNDEVDVTRLLGALDAQLAALKSRGFAYVSLDQWQGAIGGAAPLPERPLSLTFDGEWWDLAGALRSLLLRNGFGAVFFVPTRRLTGTERAVSARSRPKYGLTAAELCALQADAISLGCCGVTGEPLTMLSPTEIVAELARSRLALEEWVGEPVTTLAYPGGVEDSAVQLLAGALGFCLAVSGRHGRARPNDNRLALPRIRVRWCDAPDDVARMLADPHVQLVAARQTPAGCERTGGERGR